MHSSHEFLEALALVLCVAAVTTVLFQRLHQPVVLGYVLAGLIIGPHVPIPLVADQEAVHTLSELGVIMLMFSLGLEFSLRKLVQVGPTAGLTAVIQSSVMIWLGFITGRAFGWTTLESIFAGAVIAISSTTIIAKAFEEQGIRGKLRELVVGILIVEDLIAILLMATLTALSTGAGLSAGSLAVTTGQLLAFLTGLLVVGMLLIPRAMRLIIALNRPETTLVASIGVCFASALLAQRFGYSVALGAFLAGSLIAESGEGRAVEHLVEPVRDIFAAIFFVSVGMMIDPGLIAQHWQAIAVLTLVVIVGKIVSVSFGAFLTGNGTRTSVQAGMSLAQIGEFSFIIAGLGLTLHATGTFLYPVAVAVSAVTTLTTPWLIKAADPLAKFVDRSLPKPMQTFASLYGSWLEQLRSRSQPNGDGAGVRYLLGLILLDAAVLAGLIIGTSLSTTAIAGFIRKSIGVEVMAARVLVIAAAVLLAVPFCVGILRLTRRLGITLADMALPEPQSNKVDMAAAPRRALVVTLQVGVALLIGTPLVALTQPFLPGVPTALLLTLVLVALSVAFWRSASNLQGHARAGAQVIVEALASQSRVQSARSDADSLAELHELLPGLGDLVPVKLEPHSFAVGKTLADLNLRGLTGATVLAITRGGEGLLIPTADELLRSRDVVVLAGTHEAVAAASTLLTRAKPPVEAAPAL
jgi:monovalent cation:H+ antiporter-2, CPA2 family